MLSRFRLVPERNGQTDRQTVISISRVSMISTLAGLVPRWDFLHK